MPQIHENDAHWFAIHRGIRDYEAHFASVLPNQTIRGYFANSPDRNVLDIFAPPSFIRELAQHNLIQSGFSVSLTEERNLKSQFLDNELGIHHLTGNLFEEDFQRELRREFTHKNSGIFDTAFCMPLGAWKKDGVVSLETVWSTFSLLWDLTKDNGDIFLYGPMQFASAYPQIFQGTEHSFDRQSTIRIIKKGVKPLIESDKLKELEIKPHIPYYQMKKLLDDL